MDVHTDEIQVYCFIPMLVATNKYQKKLKRFGIREKPKRGEKT